MQKGEEKQIHVKNYHSKLENIKDQVDPLPIRYTYKNRQANWGAP